MKLNTENKFVLRHEQKLETKFEQLIIEVTCSIIFAAITLAFFI